VRTNVDGIGEALSLLVSNCPKQGAFPHSSRGEWSGGECLGVGQRLVCPGSLRNPTGPTTGDYKLPICGGGMDAPDLDLISDSQLSSNPLVSQRNHGSLGAVFRIESLKYILYVTFHCIFAERQFKSYFLVG
jgi:hypothetical protein